VSAGAHTQRIQPPGARSIYQGASPDVSSPADPAFPPRGFGRFKGEPRFGLALFPFGTVGRLADLGHFGPELPDEPALELRELGEVLLLLRRAQGDRLEG